MQIRLAKLFLAAVAVVVVVVLTAHMCGCENIDGGKPWWDCRLSSNWDGPNASRRMMNVLSPMFSDDKAKEYVKWQKDLGCDHVHLLFANGENGEGGGYDCLADHEARKTALKRVRAIRMSGMGVVAWVVSDDSDAIRAKVFSDPKSYASSLSEFHPYLSYIVLGLEMDEGRGSLAEWRALRDAIRDSGWDGPIATHHCSGRYTYAGLGTIVMDQLHPSCTPSQVKASVSRLVRMGYDVCGFEYARGRSREKAQAALDAGAFSVGNW